MIIQAFPGVIGSGKDHRCNQLISQGYEKIGFADKVREVIWEVIDWEPKTDAEYELFKKATIVISTPFGSSETLGRDMLIAIGDKIREVVGIDSWVTAWKKVTQNKPYVCIPDLRYKNELAALFYTFSENLVVTFCDYKSNKYDAERNSPAEKMAQEMIRMGYRDGQVLTERDIIKIIS